MNHMNFSNFLFLFHRITVVERQTTQWCYQRLACHTRMDNIIIDRGKIESRSLFFNNFRTGDVSLQQSMADYGR